MEIELLSDREMTPRAPALPAQVPRWETVAGAYLAEVRQRSGSERIPAEYGRYICRFLADAGNAARATPAHVHPFAYGPGPSGKPPSSSTVSVRLAAIRSFYDFAHRMRLIARNPADDVKRPRPASRPRVA